MKYAQKIRKIAVKNQKSKAQKMLDRLKIKIEDLAENGDTSIKIWWSNYELNDPWDKLAKERGIVIGTLKRLGFKIKDGWDKESQSYTCNFIVSWK